MSLQSGESDVLAVARVAPGRRIFGVGSMALLGVLLLVVAIARPPADPIWLVFLFVVGFGALWLAEKMRRATALWIELTRDGLRTCDGEVIADITEIETLDRGMFAFKPSNGFLMKLKNKGPARWQPGLWWRLGRRVGVGGVMRGAHTKAMSEMIMALQLDQN